jgi:Fic family protein
MDQIPSSEGAIVDDRASTSARSGPTREARRMEGPGRPAGSTVFVLPEFVPGTLREAFERVLALVDRLARALMMMFVVGEVHPFIDGNGRTARLAMTWSAPRQIGRVPCV